MTRSASSSVRGFCVAAVDRGAQRLLERLPGHLSRRHASRPRRCARPTSAAARRPAGAPRRWRWPPAPRPVVGPLLAGTTGDGLHGRRHRLLRRRDRGSLDRFRTGPCGARRGDGARRGIAALRPRAERARRPPVPPRCFGRRRCRRPCLRGRPRQRGVAAVGAAAPPTIPATLAPGQQGAAPLGASGAPAAIAIPGGAPAADVGSGDGSHRRRWTGRGLGGRSRRKRRRGRPDRRHRRSHLARGTGQQPGGPPVAQPSLQVGRGRHRRSATGGRDALGDRWPRSGDRALDALARDRHGRQSALGGGRRRRRSASDAGVGRLPSTASASRLLGRLVRWLDRQHSMGFTYLRPPGSTSPSVYPDAHPSSSAGLMVMHASSTQLRSAQHRSAHAMRHAQSGCSCSLRRMLARSGSALDRPLPALGSPASRVVLSPGSSESFEHT